MEQISALRQAEGTMSLMADRISAFGAKLEGLVFRAQHIANDIKKEKRVTDTMFGYDLMTFRREVKSLGQEIFGLSPILSSIDHNAVYDASAQRLAESVSRGANRVHRGILTLRDHALMAHSHIRASDHKVEAWYLIQELEEMLQKAQSLPNTAVKIVNKIALPPSIP